MDGGLVLIDDRVGGIHLSILCRSTEEQLLVKSRNDILLRETGVWTALGRGPELAEDLEVLTFLRIRSLRMKAVRIVCLA